MIEVETVLVLGAGASSDFGFPTGLDLLTRICDLRKGLEAAKKQPEHECFVLLQMLRDQGRQLNEFFQRLPMADQPSIDAWLADNQDFLPIGKLLTAYVLLQEENPKTLIRPSTWPANWYKTLFSEIKEDRQLDQLLDSDLNIRIITFNYDRSLEQYLFERVTHHYGKDRTDETMRLLKQIPIHHVYGSLGPLEWQTDNAAEAVHYAAARTASILERAAANIDIPQPAASKEIPKSFEQAREWLIGAQAIYFLGFGYHKQNMRNLGLWRPMQDLAEIWRKGRKVMGTCLGLSRKTMNDIKNTNLPGFTRGENLINKPIVEFLHDAVDFNEFVPKREVVVRYREQD